MPTAAEILDPVLDVDEIQGNILGGFNKDHQAVLPLHFDGGAEKVAAVRAWLAAFVPALTWLREVAQYRRDRRLRMAAGGATDEVPVVWRTIAFSYPGLRKLTPQADAFDAVFRDGLPAAAQRLGDPTAAGEPGNPGGWVVGGPGGIPDMLVVIAADEAKTLDKEVTSFLAVAATAGIRCSHHDIGHDLAFFTHKKVKFPSGHEHFGFKDGVSQPGVRGRLSDASGDYLTPRLAPDPEPASSVPEFDTHHQPLICPGEFVFGYPRQSTASGRVASSPWKLGPEPFSPDPNAVAPFWAKNGSFLVYRRLAQDVPAFNQFLADAAKTLPPTDDLASLTPNRLGAMLVGRWPSGAPLLRSPKTDKRKLGQTEKANNAFQYDATPDPHDGFPAPLDDPFGAVCPQAAHVRKVNPRNLGTDQGSPLATLTRRILRRGIPFGPPLPFGATSDPAPVERGLLFLSYQTSISEQFEFLATNWMNNEVNPTAQFAPPDGSGYDMILGQAPSEPNRDRFCLLGASEVKISTAGRPVKQWVTATGGGYFFAPSRTALQTVLAAREA